MATQNTLYTPALPQVVEDPQALREWAYSEMQRIANAFEQIRFNLQFDTLAVEPEKPQDALIVYADGANWDPGSGEGPYMYVNGAWEFLADSGGGGAVAWGSITGTLSDQTDLQAELDTFKVIDFFQVEDDGSTGQTTTGSYADLAGMWSAPSINSGNFTWNGATGVLTADADGTLELDVQIMTTQAANNRLQLDFDLQVDTGGGFTTVTQSNNYSSRNNTQSEGGGYLPGYKLDVASGDQVKIRIKDTGIAASVGTGVVAGGTYISAKLYS